MGIFTSSYLYYGYALGGQGIGMYAKLSKDRRFVQPYSNCTSDFGGKAILHAPDKLFSLSDLDSVAGRSRTPITMEHCRRWLACKPQEYPTTVPVEKSAAEVDAMLMVSAEQRAMLELVLSWGLGDEEDKPEPAWYFMEWMTDSYGEGNSGGVSRLQKIE